jgi:hypothetical protein
MKTYQFEFKNSKGAELVVDIDADNKYDAVATMRVLMKQLEANDDPHTITVEDRRGIYARIWFDFHAHPIIGTEDIVDEWNAVD